MLAFVVFLLVALPWLNPFAPAPTSSVGPLLFAWFCAALLLGLRAWAGRRMAHELWVQAIALAWLAAAALSAVMGLLQYFGAAAALGQWVRATEAGLAFANLRQRNQFATLINLGLVALMWWALQGRVVRGEVGRPVKRAVGKTVDTAVDKEVGEEVNKAAGVVSVTGQAGLAAQAPTDRPTLVSSASAALPAKLKSTSTPRPAPTPTLLALAVLLGVANAASSSRTGLLQLVLVAALVGLWGRWREPRVAQVMWVAAAAYVLALFALPWLAGLDPNTSAWARLRAGDAACSSRLTLWGNVLHLIAQKPWLGWGWGELDYAHFITLYPANPGARFCDILDNAHNLPLHLAVELGVPVAVALCGAAAWLIWRAKPWREADATRQLAWGVLAVIGLHSLLEYPLWYGSFQVAAVLCVALLWQVPCVNEFKRFRAIALVSQASIAITMIVMVGLVAWDYHRVRQMFLPPAHRAAAYQTHTLAKVQGAWWFEQHVQFAELTTTPLTPDNAALLHRLTQDLLHFSPEPRVIETLIDSAALLGREDDVAFYAVRYQAAFAQQYARWKERAEQRAVP